ncbi:hypothetical protein A6E01_19875 (plasmid) [Vibrio breoganii]|uniref:Uncharacterized protein n=1 Tax=Vibrio breoganii TaxID=553239 RepID=A0AAN0XZG2_9VIBR|nr:hypothetical protein [Vibrio breoganii]ANO35474.1 hypothetical protein A6E01_19875 [Vibrio breoganii]PML13922.1 hypothetical protein BCT84_12240 [Vibrio breoganii]
MSSYKIVWEVELEADSPEQAAKLAREMQLDKESEALHFNVTDEVTGDEIEVSLDEVNLAESFAAFRAMFGGAGPLTRQVQQIMDEMQSINAQSTNH